jgi:hypothetical protein
MKLGRNDPCHCGSGQKYKKCHLEKDEAARSAELAAAAAAAAAKAAAAAEEEGEGSETDAKKPGARPSHDATQGPPKTTPGPKASPIRRRAV